MIGSIWRINELRNRDGRPQSRAFVALLDEIKGEDAPWPGYLSTTISTLFATQVDEDEALERLVNALVISASRMVNNVRFIEAFSGESGIKHLSSELRSQNRIPELANLCSELHGTGERLYQEHALSVLKDTLYFIFSSPHTFQYIGAIYDAVDQLGATCVLHTELERLVMQDYYYQADVRVLREAALRFQDTNPELSRIIADRFYVECCKTTAAVDDIDVLREIHSFIEELGGITEHDHFISEHNDRFISRVERITSPEERFRCYCTHFNILVDRLGANALIGESPDERLSQLVFRMHELEETRGEQERGLPDASERSALPRLAERWIHETLERAILDRTLWHDHESSDPAI